MGKSGRRTDFSWTWKENRKNPHADDARAYGSRDFFGMAPMTSEDGRTAMKVAKSERRGSGTRPSNFLSLNTVFRAHQKLATLSSKRPLANGKHRCIDCESWSRMTPCGVF